MKKIILISVVVIGLIMAMNVSSEENRYEYLRLQIRANSNMAIDQDVKYEIKTELVEFLTPYFAASQSKQESMARVKVLTDRLELLCDEILRRNGMNYTANVKINNEYFPARNYNNITLESGYYDAVIVELGEAKGDNWWCVMYPPLCFVNNFDQSMQINYKSKIVEWLTNLFN